MFDYPDIESALRYSFPRKGQEPADSAGEECPVSLHRSEISQRVPSASTRDFLSLTRAISQC